ncbi:MULTISPECIES: methyltransferase domain-containing protein [unclassified Micromonospora]|uniref:THUMP-like domain-containing protein n=1 Tax=unclassified Micromonospora TaxID=2617518 RepID=UPI001C237529|nr:MULTISPECIES: methyltransferase domain-containing protein [unclassified Micromonospora]MBU8857041.1 methyltransferase domain-containing protein [Micromonospora sp. WMMB482]MDM4777764.1 methyltransferase domain-containing protein [Micromonospora sp. b486]MDM4782662.1 methyltransferase domain-containing protein [Micromonospora sp. b486]
MDLDQLAALRTPEGSAALAAAGRVAGGDPLAAAAALRSAGIPGGLAAAALTQAELRRRAAGKFGVAAAGMFLTRAGLEQATRLAVADRRAARLRAAGVTTLADLGCGLGADALAAARAGIRVYAVEADPVTAEMAAANAEAAGLAGLVTVECGDATTFDVTGVDAVFCDPARRRAGTGRRVFDPNAYSPPWDFVTGLAARVPRTVVKVAPGLDHALIPAGAEAEWVSVDGDLVEAALWCGDLAEVPRRATLLREKEGPLLNASGSKRVPSYHLTGTGAVEAPVGPVRRFLYDPDPAVVRAHLVAELAAGLDATLADPSIAYLYADEARPTPFARCLEITDVLPFSLKRLRALLRERRVGRVEIRKRGSALEPEKLRRDLRLSGDEAASLALTRVGGDPTVLVCRPAPAGG